jgi:hypothetical protein
MSQLLQEIKQTEAENDRHYDEYRDRTERLVYEIAIRDYFGSPKKHDGRDLPEMLEVLGWDLADYEQLATKAIPGMVTLLAEERAKHRREEILTKINFLTRDLEKLRALQDWRLRRVKMRLAGMDAQRRVDLQTVKNHHPLLFSEGKPVDALELAVEAKIEENEAHYRQRIAKEEQEQRHLFAKVYRPTEEEKEIPADFEYPPGKNLLLQIIADSGSMIAKRHTELVEIALAEPDVVVAEADDESNETITQATKKASDLLEKKAPSSRAAKQPDGPVGVPTE